MMHAIKLLYLTVLLFTANTFAQSTNPCSTMWLKADFTGLDEATSFKNKTLLKLPQKAHDTITAKTYNTLGIYMSFAGKQDSAIVYFTKAQKYLGNYPKLKAYTYINQSTAYEIAADYTKALQAATAALNLTAKYGSAITTALSYQVMAAAYFRKDELDKSVNHLLKGIALLEKANTNCYLYLLKLNLASTYIQTNNYKFAAKLFEDYLQQNAQSKGTKLYTIAVVNYTECLIELQNYDKANLLLTDAIPPAQKSGDKELVAVLYYRLGKLNDTRARLSSALNYYNKAYSILSPIDSRYSTHIFSDYLDALNRSEKYAAALALATSFKGTPAYLKSTPLERMGYEEALAEAAEKSGNLKASNSALKEALKLSDSVRQINNGRVENEMQAKYQTNFQSQKNTSLTKHNNKLVKKLESEERLLFMYIIISVGIIIVVLLYLRGYLLSTRLTKEKLKSLEADKKLVDQQRIYEQEIIKHHKLVIDEKQREATSMALRMASYYDNINILLQKFNTPGYTTLPDIKHELQQLAKQKDYWKQFETRFNNLNPEFATTLTQNYAKLTKNDIEFCTLLKLNLSNKEIASLLQISHESVITKKYRVRKKMGIQDEAELEMLLSQI